MNPTSKRKLIIFFTLVVLKSTLLSAQQNDFFKQIINESLKNNFKQELDSSATPKVDSLSGISYISLHTSKLVELNVHKNPLPKLGYNFRLNALLKQSLNDPITEELKMFDMLTPYTNSHNITYNKMMDYENMLPRNIYNDLTGNGMLSLSGIAGTIGSLRGKKKEKNTSITMKYSESEKSSITENTNQLIWEVYYANLFPSENDSIQSEFLLRKRDTIQNSELRRPPHY